MKQIPAAVSVLAMTCGLPCALAQQTVPTIEQLIERYPELQSAEIREAPIGDFYEINVSGTVTYLSKDGEYQFRGDIVELATRTNLTEVSRSTYRAELLATLDPADEIVFSPADGDVKHRVTVFTDVDCGYCRELHREIEVINELGIEVRYVSFPRTGPNTESWTKAEQVWCAADRNSALTQAKLGAAVEPAPDCTSTPVAAQFQLGVSLAMSGTPAIYSETGVEVGGYLTPDALLAALEALGTAR